MIKTYTREEFLKENPKLSVYNIDEIPQCIYDIMEDKIQDKGLIADFKPIIENGLDWVFEYIYMYQPKTAEILKRAKNPFVTLEKYEGRIIDSAFYVELGEYILEIRRSFFNYNLDESKELNNLLKNTEKIEKKKVLKISNRPCSFPLEITLSYYYHMEGMVFPDYSGVVPSNIDLLPNIDMMLEYYKYKKKDRVKLINYMEKVLYEIYKVKLNPIYMYSFVYTLNREKNNKDDYFLFTHEDVMFGDIYVVKNGDVKGIRRLKEPVKAIDEYVAYVLTKKETDFDFEPYLEEIPNKPEYIEEDYKEFEVDKIVIKNIPLEKEKEIVGLLSYYKIIAFNNLFTYYRFKGKNGWYQPENVPNQDIFSEPYYELKDVIDNYEIEEFEIIQYKLIDYYDDMKEYEVGEEEEFTMYVNYKVKKGKLEIIIPSLYRKDYKVEEMEEDFKKISKEIKVKIKSVEDNKYQNKHKDKIVKYLKRFDNK